MFLCTAVKREGTTAPYATANPLPFIFHDISAGVVGYIVTDNVLSPILSGEHEISIFYYYGIHSFSIFDGSSGSSIPANSKLQRLMNTFSVVAEPQLFTDIAIL